ncbi:beta-ketoacyl synthase N-terminal-like domain-containing protein, partial [Nocardia takedensis]|uniref:beta-ketoacyl synthase N-terminal-like domain-containing protein n=1 Tax=Nocardia takedensis TaxID=259390 RepID=UPI0014612F5E
MATTESFDESGSTSIAVVGLACRFPGAENPAAFWQLLRDGVEAVADPPARHAGTTGSPNRRGGFLDRVDGFDPAFFGISPREAVAMDPQQRLMLELAWEAVEDARVLPAALRDTATGVFVGAINDDYAALSRRVGAIGRHTMGGLYRGIIANRVSHALGLRGPSMTVDAAQGSSLVAVHLAMESLRRGDSSMAIAGGVNLILTEDGTIAANLFGGLSPSGRCHTFDARADGYVRGEGGGVVLLKPLAAALADGDRVYCVLRGSAVNNDGATDGLTKPSVQAQAAVIGSALRRSGIGAAAVGYVELHGTGTPVGDPIEAAALGAALGADRAPEKALRVGSVKTNIGHLEGAAGIAGLIKTALSVHHRQVPPSLNFASPNPGIPLARWGLAVQSRLTDWPECDEVPVAGVSSFGMGGTNCHVVLTGQPVASPSPVPAEPTVVPWVLSGRTAEAVRDAAQRLLPVAERANRVDVAWSLAETRTAFEHRAVVLGADDAQLRGGLLAVAEGEQWATVAAGVATGSV